MRCPARLTPTHIRHASAGALGQKRARHPRMAGPAGWLLAASYGKGPFSVQETQWTLRYQKAAERDACGQPITTNWDRMVRVDSSRTVHDTPVSVSRARQVLNWAAQTLDAQSCRLLWLVCMCEQTPKQAAISLKVTEAIAIDRLKTALQRLTVANP